MSEQAKNKKENKLTKLQQLLVEGFVQLDSGAAIFSEMGRNINAMQYFYSVSGTTEKRKSISELYALELIKGN